jgi:hypothetical protein
MIPVLIITGLTASTLGANDATTAATAAVRQQADHGAPVTDAAAAAPWPPRG